MSGSEVSQLRARVSVLEEMLDVYERSVVEQSTKLASAMNELQEAYHRLHETQSALVQTEKLTAMGEMAAGVAHELNQPLNSIKIIAQSIRRGVEKGGCDTSELVLDTGEIVQLVDRMAQIIDHIRTYARKSDAHLRVQFELNVAIENAVRLVSKQFREKGCQLDLQLASGLPHLCGDPVKIEQVIVNLLTNARDSVFERMEREQEYAGRVAVRSALLSENKLLFEVEDNGIGVRAEDQERIFKSFFTTKPAGRGTGLGLAIVEQIVKDHGGGITLSRSGTAGASLRVVLPIVEPGDSGMVPISLA